MATNTIPVTIPEHIEQIKNMDISYRVLHPSANILDKGSNKKLIIPFSSIINKYKDFLYQIIKEVELSEREQTQYQFKPKMVSEDLYGTTELWDTILILNNCTSVSEFKPKVLKVYDPNRFKTFLNEIMLLEEENGEIEF